MYFESLEGLGRLEFCVRFSIAKKDLRVELDTHDFP